MSDRSDWAGRRGNCLHAGQLLNSEKNLKCYESDFHYEGYSPKEGIDTTHYPRWWGGARGRAKRFRQGLGGPHQVYSYGGFGALCGWFIAGAIPVVGCHECLCCFYCHHASRRRLVLFGEGGLIERTLAARGTLGLAGPGGDAGVCGMGIIRSHESGSGQHRGCGSGRICCNNSFAGPGGCGGYCASNDEGLVPGDAQGSITTEGGSI